jgi:hypothetical protein
MFMLSFIDLDIVLSMFMLSFIFVIECVLVEWKWICAGFLNYLLLSVLPLYQDGWDPINQFNITTFLCLSQLNQDLGLGY